MQEMMLDLAAEHRPGGIPPEVWSAAACEPGPEVGLYGLWCALTSLTQEVRSQGRAFKQLDERLAPLPGRMEQQLDAHAQAVAWAEQARALALQRGQELRREGEERSRAEFLGILLDVYERMQRGLAASHACRHARGWRGWLACRLRSKALGSLEEGYRLSLEAVKECLDRNEVAPLPCEGQIFDPHTMEAVCVEEAAGVPPGAVLEVFRAGYTRRGELIRPARVKVARKPGQQGGKS